jgi:hypothetical protein
VHPVNAVLLAGGGGRYRCGKCNKVNNALEALFDEWPAAGARPPAAGELPVLGLSLDLQAAARARQAPGGAGETAGGADAAAASGAPLRWLVRLGWIGAAIALTAFIAFQVSEFLGKPLLDRAPVRAATERLGLREPPAAVPYRDLQRIHVVSRELRSHPSQSGWLRLSVTIVNRASRAQPWPDLEVTLLDVAGQVVAQQRFSPADYLADGRLTSRGMTPQAYLPLVLDFEDPGRQAVGFELEFR